jgi:hypothetical protein
VDAIAEFCGQLRGGESGEFVPAWPYLPICWLSLRVDFAPRDSNAHDRGQE